MRFFKTFNLLHRRTKSDVFVSGSPLEPAITNSGRRSSVPVSLFDLAVSQIPANFKHLDGNGSGNGVSVAVPIFGLESELNARLREANSRWANDYANLQCQLQECRKELHSERRKVQCLQRKLEEDNRIILDLRMSSRRLEGLLGVSSYATDSESQQDAISGQIGMLQNVSTLPNFVKGSFTNVMNIRTMDEYSSALRMTLATRKELRDQRKVSLYWKRKALDSNQLQSTITPSVSTISSIHDPLPVDRQIALDALISRRSLNSTLGSQMGSKDTSPKIVIPKQSPTYQPADKVGSPIAIARPVTSFANSSSCLGPLASESIKAEISSLFGSPDRVKHLTPRTRREQNHSSSLVGRLIKFTFATSTPAKKTDLTLNVESFGDLHAFFAATFGADKLVDESNDTLNRIDKEDGLMTSVLPPPTSVPISLDPSNRSALKTSNIPTRKGAVISVGSHKEVSANRKKKQAGLHIWQSSRPATTTKVKTVLEKGRLQIHQEKDKENSFSPYHST